MFNPQPLVKFVGHVVDVDEIEAYKAFNISMEETFREVAFTDISNTRPGRVYAGWVYANIFRMQMRCIFPGFVATTLYLVTLTFDALCLSREHPDLYRGMLGFTGTCSRLWYIFHWTYSFSGF